MFFYLKKIEYNYAKRNHIFKVLDNFKRTLSFTNVYLILKKFKFVLFKISSNCLALSGITFL